MQWCRERRRGSGCRPKENAGVHRKSLAHSLNRNPCDSDSAPNSLLEDAGAGAAQDAALIEARAIEKTANNTTMATEILKNKGCSITSLGVNCISEGENYVESYLFLYI